MNHKTEASIARTSSVGGGFDVVLAGERVARPIDAAVAVEANDDQRLAHGACSRRLVRLRPRMDHDGEGSLQSGPPGDVFPHHQLPLDAVVAGL